MRNYIVSVIIFILIIAALISGIWFLTKGDDLAPELVFLKQEGFLDEQGIIGKSSTLIEQNINSEDELFEVLATKLNKDNYQLAFKLENKSNEKRDFYLIPVSQNSQAEFQEINGVINNKNLLSINKDDVKKEPLETLYDIQQHKKELNPELAKAYDDIDNNNYQAKPIKITLAPNSTLLAKSQWKIKEIQNSKLEIQNSKLEPVYFLVYGSAGGAKDEIDEFEKRKLKKVTDNNYEIRYNKHSKVEIGDKDEAYFKPKAKISKWNDEVWIEVKYPTNKIINLVEEDGKLKWKDTDKEIHFYSLEPTEEMEEGGFEYEIILKERPISNRISLEINVQGLNFYYQPPLTQEFQNGYSEKFQKEIIVSETQVKDLDGNILVERPENVVGSYAVYHATKRDHIEGETNYKTGKAFHIYRPRIIDSNGWEVWGDLKIDEQAGTLAVTMPQNFINNAVYPIRHATGLTFGYESIGASWINRVSGVNHIAGSAYSPASNGTLVSASIYSRGGAANIQFKIGLYDSSDNSFDGGTLEGTSIYNSYAWNTANADGTVSVSSGISYLIAFKQSGNHYVTYDTGAVLSKYQYSNYVNSWPNPASWTDDSTNYKYSVYITYNVAPTITSVQDYPDPIEAGKDITFSVDWNDADAEGIKMLICKTNAITAGASPSCNGGQWCSNDNDYDLTDPIICAYTLTTSEIGSNNYYAFVCDNEPACSSSTSGTFTVQSASSPSKIFKGGTIFKGGIIIK